MVVESMRVRLDIHKIGVCYCRVGDESNLLTLVFVRKCRAVRICLARISG